MTQRNAKGMAYYPHCVNECEKENCRFCPYETQIAERIAAYEDLEVTPKQIREMDNAYLEKCEEVNKLRLELEEYKQLEEQINDIYGEDATMKIFTSLLMHPDEEREKIKAGRGELEKMTILTNETADEWEAYKNGT